jgi:heat shock protein HtpX
MKKFRPPTYFFEFLAAMVRNHNIPMAIYLLLNAVLGIGILSSLAGSFFGVSSGTAYTAGGVIYLIMLMVIFSPVGEAWMRYQVKVCEVPPAEAKRLEPLFSKVMDRAKKVNPRLDDRISLFLAEDDSMNAFAVGRRTVVLNTGVLSLPNDQLAGILTHEVGHISHKDTDLRMAVMAGNGVVSLGFTVMRLIISLFTMLVNIFARGGILGLVGMIFSLAAQLFSFILSLAQRFWLFLGKFAMSYSARRQELRADEFSVNCGAGKGLSRFLSALLEQEGAQLKRSDLLSAFMSSHPEMRARLVALADLGVPIERPDLLVE